jgi:hypothetical protein
MPPYYPNDFLTTLAYLMGEKTVNSSTSAPRSDFIQSALHDAYGAFAWPFTRNRSVITLASGIATLPTDYDPRHESYIFMSDTQNASNDGTRLDPVLDADSNQLIDGDRAAWIELPDSGDGTRFVLKTKDSDLSSLYFRYQKVEPVLAASLGTPYPNKRTIALGARAYVKIGQNPDADVSQELKMFENELAKDIAQFQVKAPRKRRRTAQSQTGSLTGEF